MRITHIRLILYYYIVNDFKKDKNKKYFEGKSLNSNRIIAAGELPEGFLLQGN